MTNKKPYLVKLKGKGLDGLAMTETIAREMCSSKSRHYMAVIEVMVDEIHDKSSGQITADLTLNQFWPATDDNLEDHLRNLTKTLHQNAGLHSEDGQLTIETGDDLEPTVEGVIAAGGAHITHEHVPTGRDTDDCDLCGRGPDAPVHQVPDTATTDDDPDQDPDSVAQALDLDDDSDPTDEDLGGDPETAADEPPAALAAVPDSGVTDPWAVPDQPA